MKCDHQISDIFLTVIKNPRKTGSVNTYHLFRRLGKYYYASFIVHILAKSGNVNQIS